jgi:hypothetical protein
MRYLVALLIVLAVVGGPAAVGAGEPVTRVFHDGIERAWGEVSDHLRGLGGQLERHLFGGPGGPSPAERPVVSIMLEHREALGLSPEQTSRLETLRAEFAREAIRREAEIRIAEMDLAALLDQDPLDLPRVEAKIREVAQLRADLRIARLRTIEQGKAVLTAEQRARLQSLLGGGRPPRRTADRPARL